MSLVFFGFFCYVRRITMTWPGEKWEVLSIRRFTSARGRITTMPRKGSDENTFFSLSFLFFNLTYFSFPQEFFSFLSQSWKKMGRIEPRRALVRAMIKSAASSASTNSKRRQQMCNNKQRQLIVVRDFFLLYSQKRGEARTGTLKVFFCPRSNKRTLKRPHVWIHTYPLTHIHTWKCTHTHTLCAAPQRPLSL